MSAVKERINEIINEMPDDSTYDDILRELAFARMIDRGMDDSKSNRTVSNDEMLHRIKTW